MSSRSSRLPRLVTASNTQFIQGEGETAEEFQQRQQDWIQDFRSSVYRELQGIYSLIVKQAGEVEPNTEIVTTGTTWTPPAGVYAVLVARLQAGGGAGGSKAASNNQAGGGGGSCAEPGWYPAGR